MAMVCYRPATSRRGAGSRPGCSAWRRLGQEFLDAVDALIAEERPVELAFDE